MSSDDDRWGALELAAHEALAIMRRHAVTNWAFELEWALALIKRREKRGLDRLLAMYGGMGSINDILVSRVNGHSVTPAEEEIVNQTLAACLQRANGLARQLQREAL